MKNFFEKYCLPRWNLIFEILSMCLHNLFVSKDMIHYNESPLISTHGRLSNVREFLYSIIFLFLGVYLVHTYVFFFFFLFLGPRVSVHIKLESIKSLMITNVSG